MLDNIEIAILTRLNDLAERHGLRPSDFVATVRSATDEDQTILAFEAPAAGNALREERYRRMLLDLGVSADGVLKAPDGDLLDALDAALQRAPRPRHRF